MVNPVTVTDIQGISALVLIIGGIFGAIGYGVSVLLRGRDQGRTEANEATNFVIGALKEQIAVLEKRVSEQAVGLEAMGKRLEEVVKENQELKAILQGRDSQTQRFQEEGFKAMQRSDQVIASIAEIEQRVNKILDIIEHRQVVVTKIHKDIQDALDKKKK